MKATQALVVLLMLSCVFVGAPIAQADVREEARILVQQGRLPEARMLLLTELTSSPSAAIAFNLALVERDLGHLGAAKLLFERLVAGEFGPLPPDRQTRAEELEAEVSAAMPRLRIRWTGEGVLDLQVDGRPAGQVRGAEAQVLHLDPGAYVVEGSGANVSIVREVTLVTGVRDLILEPPQAPEASVPTPDGAGERAPSEALVVSDSETSTDTADPRRRRRRIILLTLAALMVGGAVVTAVTLSQREGSPPDHYLDVIRF